LPEEIVDRRNAFHKKQAEAENKTQEQLRPFITEVERRLGVQVKLATCYGKALLKWALAGFPVRDEVEAARVLAVCVSDECGKYSRGRCSKCSCRVNTSKIPVVNKCKMATEDCPEGWWYPLKKYDAV
jgi:hypothetical protein